MLDASIVLRCMDRNKLVGCGRFGNTPACEAGSMSVRIRSAALKIWCDAHLEVYIRSVARPYIVEVIPLSVGSKHHKSKEKE